MKAFVFILTCLLALSASARTITVDDGGFAEFDNIQAAIDDSNDGDTVIIAPGTYTGPGNRDIDFLGKAITVRSTNPKDLGVVTATVIDCNGTEAEPHRGFEFHSGENQNSVIDGLTIRNGYCDPNYWSASFRTGGAISCNEAAPKIINCIITDNHARSGGGIYCNDATDLRIINCTIGHNTCDSSGAGIYCLFSSVLVERCVVSGNSIMGRDDEYGWGAGINCGHCDATVADCVLFANASSYVGGGFYSSHGSATLSNCTIVDNSAQFAGGVYVSGYDLNGTMSNCIVWDNRAPNGAQVYMHMGYTISIGYSDIQGGQADVYVSSTATLNWGEGNIEADPGFVDVVSSNYHLSPDSPCIDAGNPNHVPFSGEADIDGHERIANGRVDIGADEFGSAPVPILDVWPGNLDYFVYEDYGNPPAQLLAIQNGGAGVMNWAITEDCPWLDVSSLNGECIDETDYVTVSADVSGLADGIYDCQLVVDAEGAIGGQQIIDVNLVIHGPEIELSATQFEFTAVEGRENPSDRRFIVRNAGGATLNWDIVADANWLEVTPNVGSSRGEATEVTLSVDISALTWGNYQCDVVVADANSINNPQTVSVDLHVFVGEVVQVPEYVPTIQQAIDHVLERGTVIVADGIYIGEGNRDIDFKGKSITVRSENGPENCIVDCSGAQYEHFNGFVFLDGEDANSVLDGFTITNAEGHAIYCYRARATVRNCIMNDGGSSAIHLRESDLSVTNCIISNNRATGGGHAGGSTGGGIYLTQSRATITNCIITGNMAYGGAGGIHCYGSRPIITNCTICDNVGSGIWGVPYYGEPYHPIIANCILWGNSLEQMVVDPNYTIVAYSNIQDGWPGLGNISEDPCFVSPGYWDPNGTTHTRYDDFWVQGDYHLKSEGWRWDTQRGVWTWEDVTSRCIDAGNPASPLGDEPLSVPADPNNDWGVNVRINMGAYGGTGQASIPPNGWSVSKDYNNDGIVNFTDFACWSIYHGYILPEPPDNSSPSPTLNAADLALFADRWLDQTTWFTTPSPASSLPPNAASNPNPPDGSVAIRLDPVLSWQPGFSALSHDVYFGTSSPGTFQGNQTETTFQPDPLDYETLYHWRIDELNDDSKTTGTVWTFTTTSGKTRCFPADTGVWVDGVLVQISKVIPGQKVGKASNALASACLYEVESVQEHSESEGPGVCYDIVLESGNRISVVDCHYFLVDSGRWVAVQNLRSGSKLMSLNGPITVSRIVKRAVPFVGKCYNLKIKGSERYFIGKDAVIVRDW